VSAKPRSLLKLDQAYIAVGGREHLTLERETDIMRVIALRISPRDAEVPSSTLSADEMQGAEFSTRITICLVYLPLGLNRMRIG